MHVVISSELINTNSAEANVQLAHIHEHLFARPAPHSLRACAPELVGSILGEQLSTFLGHIGEHVQGMIIASAQNFSRMLHSSPAVPTHSTAHPYPKSAACSTHSRSNPSGGVSRASAARRSE